MNAADSSDMQIQLKKTLVIDFRADLNTFFRGLNIIFCFFEYHEIFYVFQVFFWVFFSSCLQCDE